MTRGEAFAEILFDKAEAGEDKALDMMLRRFWPEKLALEHSGSIASDDEILEAQRRAGLIPDPDKAA